MGGSFVGGRRKKGIRKREKRDFTPTDVKPTSPWEEEEMEISRELKKPASPGSLMMRNTY